MLQYLAAVVVQENLLTPARRALWQEARVPVFAVTDTTRVLAKLCAAFYDSAPHLPPLLGLVSAQPEPETLRPWLCRLLANQSWGWLSRYGAWRIVRGRSYALPFITHQPIWPEELHAALAALGRCQRLVAWVHPDEWQAGLWEGVPFSGWCPHTPEVPESLSFLPGPRRTGAGKSRAVPGYWRQEDTGLCFPWGTLAQLGWCHAVAHWLETTSPSPDAPALAYMPAAQLPLAGLLFAGSTATGATVWIAATPTPEALTNAIETLRRAFPHGRHALVWGPEGGEAQPWEDSHRPKMLAVGLRAAHPVWLTANNPRCEAWPHIVATCMAGLSAVQQAQVQVLYHRASAIQEAVTQAQAGDTVLLAGRDPDCGHQIFCDHVQPYSDLDCVIRTLSL
jgi:hypothetical protein